MVSWGKFFKLKQFLGEGDFVEEEVNIENWDTDTIVQFLDEKLTH